MKSEESSRILSEFTEIYRNKSNLYNNNYYYEDYYEDFDPVKNIQIGFIFSNICNENNHNNIKEIEGIILSLLPLNFNVTILSIYSCNNEEKEKDNNNKIDNVKYDYLIDNLEENINKIEKYKFDILFFNDILSDWNIFLLANLRLSKIQISYYGSVMKTPFNLPTIDYYLTIDNNQNTDVVYRSKNTQTIRLEDQGVWLDYQNEYIFNNERMNDKRVKYLCLSEIQYIDASYYNILKEIMRKVENSELYLLDSYI